MNLKRILSHFDFLILFFEFGSYRRRNSTREAFQVRENFKEYFNSEGGSVVWQLSRVRKGTIHT